MSEKGNYYVKNEGKYEILKTVRRKLRLQFPRLLAKDTKDHV
jgi:hypothetical protein